MMKSNTIIGYCCALCAVMIWSGFILVSREGGLSLLTSFDVIAIRYSVCALLLFPAWIIYRVNIWQPKLIVSSLIGALLYALFAFQGFELTPASHSAVLLPGIMPLAITILSVWLLKSEISRIKWLGVSFISAGIGILLIESIIEQKATHSQGHLFIIASALCWALYSVLLSKWQITPWQATVSLSFITFLIYLPIYIVWLPKNIMVAPISDIILQAFYQGFLATIVQMLLYVRAIQLIGAPAMGSMMALVPIIAGIAATFLFNETLSIPFLVTLALVSLGVWLANQIPKKKPHTINQGA